MKQNTRVQHRYDIFTNNDTIVTHVSINGFIRINVVMQI